MATFSDFQEIPPVDIVVQFEHRLLYFSEANSEDQHLHQRVDVSGGLTSNSQVKQSELSIASEIPPFIATDFSLAWRTGVGAYWCDGSSCRRSACGSSSAV
jgi:hypothetical protein